MKRTCLLPSFVAELWAHKAAVGVTTGKAVSCIKAPDGDQLHIELGAAPNWARVCYYVARPDGVLTKNLEVVFVVITPGEWIPVHMYLAGNGARPYVRIDEETGEMTLVDPINQWACAAFCDWWTLHLREQGWLTNEVMV